MHLSTTAARRPAAVAAIGPGGPLTYGALDDASRRLATLFEARGLRAGDSMAILLPNSTTFCTAAWGAQRAGLFFVPINWHLTAREAVYVGANSGARALVTDRTLAGLAAQIVAACPDMAVRLMSGEATQGFDGLDSALGESSRERPDAEPNGSYMFYSSGTTGRPKGVKPQRPGGAFGTPLNLEPLLADRYGFDEETVYLSTGPMYHAAPLGWTLGTQALGGTAVLMERFDAEACLSLIEEHRVTHAQFVPTMFVRLLKLPDSVRRRYDLSSLRVVIHAAAPCAPEVKRAMIDWLGPLVHEYYAGSEGNGFFAVDSRDWLAHPGTVGRAVVGVPHILDEAGHEVRTGEVGQIWVDSPRPFSYHDDPEKTALAYNDRGWSTIGDLGRLDEEGYLYLADRRTDLIISGGVNIYPREVEEALALHPAVSDIAVVGVPDQEMGERVVAVVELSGDVAGGESLSEEMLDHLAQRLAPFKRPRRIVFVETLPRLPSGKILRREVREMLASDEVDDRARRETAT